MKPEDLVIGKTYLFLDQAREYLGKAEGFDEPHYLFNRDQETDNFGDRLILNAWDIRHSVEEIGEKTMPEERTVVTVPIKDVIHCNRYEEYNPELAMKAIGGRETARRKPGEIRIQLKAEEIIKALNSLGYDLTDYELGTGQSLPIFALRLKKEADEKTTD